MVGLLVLAGTILWGVLWQLPHDEKKEAENLATAIRTVSVSAGSATIKTLSKGPGSDGARDITVVLRYDIKNVDTKQHEVRLCTLTGTPGEKDAVGEPATTEWCVDLTVGPNAHLRGAKQPDLSMTCNPWHPKYRVLVKPYIDRLDGGMVVTDSNSLVK